MIMRNITILSAVLLSLGLVQATGHHAEAQGLGDFFKGVGEALDDFDARVRENLGVEPYESENPGSKDQAQPPETVVEPPAAAPQLPASQSLSFNRDRKLTADVQAMLTSLGYEPGPVDGAYGRKTRSAIQAFQKDLGVAQTGDVTPELRDALAEAGGLTTQVAVSQPVQQSPQPTDAAPTVPQPPQATAVAQAGAAVASSGTLGPSALECASHGVSKDSLKQKIRDYAIELGKLHADARRCRGLTLGKGKPTYGTQYILAVRKYGPVVEIPATILHRDMDRIITWSAEQNYANPAEGSCPSLSLKELQRTVRAWIREMDDEASLLQQCGASADGSAQTIVQGTTPPALQAPRPSAATKADAPAVNTAYQAPAGQQCPGLRADIDAAKERIRNYAVEVGKMQAALQRCSRELPTEWRGFVGEYRDFGGAFGLTYGEFHLELERIISWSAEQHLAQPWDGSCPEVGSSRWQETMDVWRRETPKEEIFRKVNLLQLCEEPADDADQTVAAGSTTATIDPKTGTAAPLAGQAGATSGTTPWMTYHLLKLAALKETTLNAKDDAVQDAVRTQIRAEQDRWRHIDDPNLQRAFHFFPLEWQRIAGSDPALANGAVLDLFIDHAADRSFAESLPGYKPQYDDDIDAMLHADVETVPEVFLFARESIEGRQIDFVLAELTPVYLTHLRLAAERVPTRMKFRYPLSVGLYNFEKNTLPIAAEMTNVGSGSGEERFALLSESHPGNRFQRPKDARGRKTYTLDRDIVQAMRDYTPGNGRNNPIGAWVRNLPDATSGGSGLLLSLDRRLVIPPFPMEPRTAEAIIKASKQYQAKRFQAVVTIEVLPNSARHGNALSSSAYVANVIGVEVLEPQGSVFAAFEASDFPRVEDALSADTQEDRPDGGANDGLAGASSLDANDPIAKWRKQQEDRRLAEAEQRQLAAKPANADQVQPAKIFDILGMRVGMPLAEAKQIIRENVGSDAEVLYTQDMLVWMQSENLLDTQRRPFDLTHGIVFTSRDFSQHIAVYVNPTSPTQELIAIARDLRLPDELVHSQAVKRLLTNKYGAPTVEQERTWGWYQSPNARRNGCDDVQAALRSRDEWVDIDGKKLAQLYGEGQTKLLDRATLLYATSGLVEERAKTCGDALGAMWSGSSVTTWLVNPKITFATNKAIMANIKETAAEEAKNLEGKLKF